MGQYSKIFKPYDIRGIVPDELDETVAEAIGAAFARLTGAPSIAVVHDMRTSSPLLAEAFARGVCAQGSDVIAGGLGPTDMLYYASGSLGVPGAMITASHNPSKYNGLKLCRSGAKPVGRDSGLTELREAAEQGLAPAPGRQGTEAAGQERSCSVRVSISVMRRHADSAAAEASPGTRCAIVTACRPLQIMRRAPKAVINGCHLRLISA